MEALKRSGAELLLRALPLAIMAAVAASYVATGPGTGILPLLSLGPAFAALSAGPRYTLAIGTVALLLCAALSVYEDQVGSRRDIVAFVTVAGTTAASLIATEVRRRREQELLLRRPNSGQARNEQDSGESHSQTCPISCAPAERQRN